MFKSVIDTNTYIAILEQRHADELYYLIDGNRESISEWLSFPIFTNKVQDTQTFISRSLELFASNNGYWAGIWHNREESILINLFSKWILFIYRKNVGLRGIFDQTFISNLQLWQH
ncbi:hypothetical protein M4D55_07440 [Metabacillus idriensis]|uniref:hypothetical protein n=1 Tax=Metabacillus idriensis TaxID=324768 RepID=UPI00203DC6DF|nr:hypothetical protein [Metabacillus idriensis]MCM3595615.1 hypothetical protein [Metabacillus idriensis]